MIDRLVKRPFLGVFLLKLIIGGFSAFLLYKLILKLFGKNSDSLQLPENNNYTDSTITQFQSDNLAKDLHNAMDQFGTDEARIQSIFDQLTVNDALKVYNSFGLRSYDLIGVGGLPWVNKQNLAYWLNHELNKNDPAYQSAKQKLDPHNLL